LSNNKFKHQISIKHNEHELETKIHITLIKLVLGFLIP